MSDPQDPFWNLSPTEYHAHLQGARSDVFSKGMFLGILIGAVGLPVACQLLPEQLRERMSESVQSDGETAF